MKSYLNDPKVKAKFLKRIKAHQKADRLVQDYGYWVSGRGCAVGCCMETNYDPHAQYPIQLGLPEWLAHMEDHLFENLPAKDALRWPGQFLKAIPVGVPEEAFTRVRDRFLIFWLERQKTQIDQAAFPRVVDAIDGVISLLNATLEGRDPEKKAWNVAREVARSAAQDARGSAQDAVARSAAESAARSAARSAGRNAGRNSDVVLESTGWSAARSAAWSAADSMEWSERLGAAESAAWSAALSAAWSKVDIESEREARVKRDWLLAELKSLIP